MAGSMAYNTYVIRMVQPFLDRTTSLERVLSYRSRARTMTNAALKELRDMIRLQAANQGWKENIGYNLHPLMVAGFGTLDEITAQDAPASLAPGSLQASEQYDGLVLCLRAISLLADGIYYAQAFFRHLAQASLSAGIQLPDEIHSVLNAFQSDEWTRFAASFVSSQYVPEIRVPAGDVDGESLEEVVLRWEQLGIAEERAKSSTTTEDATATPSKDQSSRDSQGASAASSRDDILESSGKQSELTNLKEKVEHERT